MCQGAEDDGSFSFSVNTEVKQGYGRSLLLINYYTDGAVREIYKITQGRGVKIIDRTEVGWLLI